MSFLYPYFIYFLLPVVTIVFGLLFIKKDITQYYFSSEVMKKLKVNANTLSIRTRNILFFISVVLIVIALAQPVIKDGSVEIKAKSSDIVIALDISDSMLAQDVYPNRLESAKQKAIKFLKDISNERVGVVAFAKNSYLVSPLSFDTAAVAFLLSQLDTTSITQKGTNFLSMLEVVANLKTSTQKKYLLILSDGGDNENFTKEIEFAKKNDIVIFILGIGTIKGAPIKLNNGEFIKYNNEILISKLNEKISNLATSTGGVYIQNTTSQKDIVTMIDEISRVSEKKELKAQEIQKYIPLFYYPLSFALLLILIATSSFSNLFKNKASYIMIFFTVAFLNSDLKAGMLDFLELNEAKKAYEAGNYEKSAKLYQKHAQDTVNPYSYYNAGNAFYKQKKYKEAVKLYEKAVFQKKEYKANTFANLGNAYAKQGTLQNLKKAKKYYEESLNLIEDKEVRKNLELVKEIIKEEEKNKKEDKKENKKEESEDKNKQENKDKNQDSTQQDDNEDIKNKNKDKKNQENKNNKDKEEKSQNKESENQDKKEQQNKEKTDKNKENSKQKKEEEQQKQEIKNQNETKVQMSDEEEEKWLKKLNLNQKTYLYRLNEQKQNEVNGNEKPW